jgi:uncharacterized MAPEG superfamily protein
LASPPSSKLTAQYQAITKGKLMSTELYWLILTSLMTSVFWLPYMIDRVNVRGAMGAFGYPGPDTPQQSAWAERTMAAHRNANENLTLFAIAVLALHLTSAGTELTALAAMIMFFARAAHFILHSLGVPVFRTVAFAIGWVCFLIMALTALGSL